MYHFSHLSSKCWSIISTGLRPQDSPINRYITMSLFNCSKSIFIVHVCMIHVHIADAKPSKYQNTENKCKSTFDSALIDGHYMYMYMDLTS